VTPLALRPNSAMEIAEGEVMCIVPEKILVSASSTEDRAGMQPAKARGRSVHDKEPRRAT
jgi:hypothetical protein